ncbi:MAG: YbbR-like domain-containing protein, partial [Prevotella sp.]
MKNKILKNIMKMRKFLLAFANKKFLIFLFFLFLSTIFWLSIALNEVVEKEISVPIRLVNVPQNAVITTPLPDSVRVTLRDKGFALLSYLYGDKLHSIAINFLTYTNKNANIGQVPNTDIQKYILQYLYASTHLISIKPDKFDFYYNYGLSKRVSIRLKGTIRTASGYYLSQVRFNPERVTIYASRHL